MQTNKVIMITELTLKENNEYEIDVFNSEYEVLFTVEGYAEIEATGITFCVISKTTDSYGETLVNFATKEWVISVLENNNEIKDRMESLNVTINQSTLNFYELHGKL
jgi:hypothetical protein